RLHPATIHESHGRRIAAACCSQFATDLAESGGGSESDGLADTSPDAISSAGVPAGIRSPASGLASAGWLVRATDSPDPSSPILVESVLAARLVVSFCIWFR